jgi:spore maturation protein CgeB
MKNKKIAIYYHTSFGRNDGPPLYYFNVMKNQMGLNILHLMPEGDTRDRFGDFDYHFWVDYGEDGLPTDKNWEIPKDGGKTIYVCSDAHIEDNGKNYRFNMARKFDYAFFNQQRALDEYTKEGGTNGKLLLHAAEPQAYPNFSVAKKYDVSFIGHFQDVKNYNNITRIEFLDAMFKAYPNFYFGTRSPVDPTKNMFEDASKRFGESRVVLNISIKDDINMRVFEVLSSGSFLLTNDIPHLKLVGEAGEHFDTYKTIQEAIEKTKYYLEHEDKREKIAKAGHEMFMNTHTYKHRIESIFNFIKGKEK